VKLVEDKANGPAIISVLEHEIPGIIAVEPEGSKESRAHSVTYLCEAGNVYLPDPSLNPWVHDFVDELANFPNGTHDDQVDAMTQALRRLETCAVGFMPFSVPRQNAWLRDAF
jgi:predicted phage terminase large subunit-like protein